VLNTPARRLRAIERALRKRPVPAAELPSWAAKLGGPPTRHRIEEFLVLLHDLRDSTQLSTPLLDWDIDRARHLISERPRVAQRVHPEWLAEWLARRTTVTAEHLDHIPPEKLDEPAIIVEVGACPPGCDPRAFRILIDGTHRLARKLRDGQACWAYLLTDEEQSSICTYRVRGQVAEMPTLPGWGIEEREAAIIVNSPAPRDDVV
jgi:hypothetical protein